MGKSCSTLTGETYEENGLVAFCDRIISCKNGVDEGTRTPDHQGHNLVL